MKILIPVDGSGYTKRALAYLAAHPEWLGAHHQYTLLHVVPKVPPRAAAVIEKAVLAAYYKDEADKVFKPLRRFFVQHGLEAQYLSQVGHAAEQISAVAAKSKPDLVLMGSHGHSALGNLVLGSVATKVLATCQVPVLLVR
jgi:nucleotide-binding universal stress UspA family protein